MGEFRHHRRRSDDASIQRRQNVDVLDEDEILKGTCIGDDNHVAGCSAGRVGELRLPLFSQSSAGLALAFEIVDGVFERNTVSLQKSVKLIAGRDVEQLPKLVASDPLHSVCVDGQRLESGSG